MLSVDNLVDQYILPDDQTSYDPYDIWNTRMGILVKKIFYQRRWLGVLPAAALTVVDFYFNNSLRLGYSKRNYPVVYAYRALIATELYRKSADSKLLDVAKKSLTWLVNNYSTGYSGYCWGANMPWVSKNGVYTENTPFITNTPYVLEALLQYARVSGDTSFNHIVPTIFEFIERDLIKQVDTKNELALSYSPQTEQRIVINANSYAMYCYSLFYSLYPEKSTYISEKIKRICNFLKQQQQPDGSWLYYADNEQGNFIDCFHSCFILKNLIRVNKIIRLEGAEKMIETGYSFIKDNFFDSKKGLFRRFSKQDSISLIKFDLYDNAEMLNLAGLLNDKPVTEILQLSIKEKFIAGNDIYSQIIFPNKRINRNTLRWAVMPLLYALVHNNIKFS